MTKRVVWIYVVAVICYSCGNVERENKDSVAGTYVREYSREILNQLSGNKLGIRIVRDTLYITSVGDSYKVENAKWSMNDYDDQGWQNMEHGDSGPMPVFQAKYDERTKTLEPDSPGLIPSLYLKEGGKISVGNKSEIAYTKAD